MTGWAPRTKADQLARGSALTWPPRPSSTPIAKRAEGSRTTSAGSLRRSNVSEPSSRTTNSRSATTSRRAWSRQIVGKTRRSGPRHPSTPGVSVEKNGERGSRCSESRAGPSQRPTTQAGPRIRTWAFPPAASRSRWPIARLSLVRTMMASGALASRSARGIVTGKGDSDLEIDVRTQEP